MAIIQATVTITKGSSKEVSYEMKQNYWKDTQLVWKIATKQSVTKKLCNIESCKEVS